MSKLRNVLLLLFVCLVTVRAGQGVQFYKAGFPDVAKAILLADFKNEPAAKAENSFYLGNVFFLENNADSASYYFNAGLAADPLYPQNQIGLIMLKMKTMDAKALDAELTKIVKEKKNKKNVDLLVAIGYAFLYNGLDNKALEYQTLAKEVAPKNPIVSILKGDIVEKQNVGEACANYEMASLYDKNNIQAYIKYARAYKNVNSKLALDKLTQLKKIDPAFTLADREFGDVYYSMNDFDKAASYYETYLNSGNKTNVSDLVRYSMTLFFKGDYNKSLDLAEAGQKKDPKSPAFNRLVLYNCVDTKKYDEALKAADMLFNNSTDANISAFDHKYYARALKETKRYDKAADEFKKAIVLEPKSTDLYENISDMYKDAGNYTKAIEAYNEYVEASKAKENYAEKATEFNIDLGKLYYSAGTDTTAKADKRKEALLKADSIFGLVATQKPDDYRGNFWRARTNSALDPETTAGLAKPYYEQTLTYALAKNDPRYNTILIECYSYLGYYTLLQKDYTSSIGYWNKILALDPNNAVAKRAIAGIQIPKSKK